MMFCAFLRQHLGQSRIPKYLYNDLFFALWSLTDLFNFHMCLISRWRTRASILSLSQMSNLHNLSLKVKESSGMFQRKLVFACIYSLIFPVITQSSGP